MRTCGVGHPQGATVTFPAGRWSNATKDHAGGNLAGVQMCATYRGGSACSRPGSSTVPPSLARQFP